MAVAVFAKSTPMEVRSLPLPHADSSRVLANTRAIHEIETADSTQECERMYHDVLAAIDVSQVNSLRETGDSLPQPAMQAIYRLMNACEYARHAGRSTWEFAVKITELLREGISENELRLLVCRGYVEHAKEVTTRSCSERAFNKDVSLRFSKRTAFILSETGIAFCRESLEAQWRSDECGEISVRCGESAPALCNGKHGDETITNAHNDVV